MQTNYCSYEIAKLLLRKKKKLVGYDKLHWEVFSHLYGLCTFLIAQLVKNLPAMQETLIQFLGQDDPLEKG